MPDHSPPTDEQLAAWQALCDHPAFRRHLEALYETGEAVGYLDKAALALPLLLAEVRRLRVALAAEREACEEVAEGYLSSVPTGGDSGHLPFHGGRRVAAADILDALRARGQP